MDWLDLLEVQGTLKSLLQHHSSKASILRRSAFFTAQVSHPYMTTGKTIGPSFLNQLGAERYPASAFPCRVGCLLCRVSDSVSFCSAVRTKGAELSKLRFASCSFSWDGFRFVARSLKSSLPGVSRSLSGLLSGWEVSVFHVHPHRPVSLRPQNKYTDTSFYPWPGPEPQRAGC